MCMSSSVDRALVCYCSIHRPADHSGATFEPVAEQLENFGLDGPALLEMEEEETRSPADPAADLAAGSVPDRAPGDSGLNTRPDA